MLKHKSKYSKVRNKSTVQSRFSDINFSDNLRFSGYFSIYYTKSIWLVTLCSNLVIAFAEFKSVNKFVC